MLKRRNRTQMLAGSTGAHTRRHLFEALEDRRLLAELGHSVLPVLLPHPDPKVIALEWQGQTAYGTKGEWLVGFEDVQAGNAGVEARLGGAGVAGEWGLSAAVPASGAGAELRSARRLGGTGVFLVEAEEGAGYNQLAAAFSGAGGWKYVEPNFLWSTSATLPVDPRFGELWGLHNTGQTGGTADADIDAPEAWDMFRGSSTVVVASIDTGVDYTHPDLAANMWVNPGEIPGDRLDNDNNGYVDDIYGIDSANNDTDPRDDHGHGTHTSGTMGAVGDNGVGVAGVNWNVQIMALKFLDASGNGSTDDAVTCLDYLTDMKLNHGVNLVASNNSWGGGGFSQALVDAIAASNAAGIMFVASAGNSGSNNDPTPSYPGSYDLPGIISVAATDHNDALAGFSNYGATSVDLGAPGVSILSTIRNSSYGLMSGTSMASPHVAGAVALARAMAPTASLSMIKAWVMDTADDIPALAGKTVSGGRLNLSRMVEAMGLTVIASVPADGAMVSLPPADFVIDFSTPYTPGTAAAGDLLVNGVAATTVTLTDADTLTFHFNTTPVAAQGPQTMQLSAGSLTRQSDGAPLLAWTVGFRYDMLPLQVTGTLPAEGVAMQLPCTTLQVNFTEEVAPASVDTTDLVLSQGRVTGATRIDADTVQYTLADILREGPLAVSIPAGALTDVFGNPSVSYRGSFDLDVDTVPFPTPLEAKLPRGSLIYDLSAEGVIGVAGDTDRFTIALDAGQRVTVVVQPDAGLRPGVQLTAPGGGTAAASAAAAGQDAVLANFAAAAAGTYTIAVSGAGGTTGTYAVQLILNADVEAEEHGGPANDTPATAQDLGPAMQTLDAGSAQRGAVLGSLPPIIATVYSANMDANPGWTFGGAWAYGVPTGAGGDPLSGFTGNNVIGYNLAGSYANSMPVYYATAPAISTTGYSGLMLSFQRWLGVEDSEFDRATVQVSNNGTTWTTVWDHTGVDFQDTSWSLQTYALPALADNQPTVYLRWAMGPTDGSLTYSGWNLDDVEVYAASLAPPDYYAVDLAAGQSLTVAAASLDRGSVAVELQNAAGTTLALGKAAGNAEAVINGLVAPASGTYYVRVSGAGNYTLLVTREAAFDTEPNDSVGDAQWLQGAPAALGYLTGEPPLAAPPAFAAAGGGSNGYVPGLDSGATGAGGNWFGTAGVDYAADRLLVGYHGSGEELAAQAAAVGGRVLAQWPFISAALVEVGGTSLTAAAKALAGEPWVWYVEPDYVVHTLATLPNDPRFGDLWGLHNTGQSGGLIDADIDAPEAWDVVTGARTVVVADIDTGADYTHPDLAANMWVNRGEIRGNGVDDDGNGYVDDIYGIDTAYGDSDPLDGDGHGTHTAGTIGAVGDNGIGVAGVTWDVQIMALKFLDDSGSGSTSGAVEALQYMTRMKTQYGVNLVASNNSWGGGAFSQALQDAIQASNDAGILFVAAAGNEGSNNDAAANYPSNYPLDGIIAVAATDRSDQLASFSNYGLTTVDLGAPGVDIWSTVPGGGYASISGTSMATPHVTGAVALLAAASPGASSEAIKDAILGGADPIAALAGKTVSGARLNLARAVALLGDPGDYYRFAATADDSLLIETYTPGDRPGEFVNVLDPKLELYGSSGALLATNDNAAFDGRNARLTYAVSQTGVYTVRVFSAAEGGEYVVRVTGNTSDNPAPAVVATEPADGARLPGFPASYRVVFSEQILLSSLAAGDFAVAGVPALAVTVVDGRTFDFSPDPAAFAEEGTYSVTVAAGAVSDLQGQGNLPFTATFVVDTTPPRIVSSSLSENQLLPEGPLTYQAGLSEPIRGGNLDPSDVVLVGQRTGPYAATSVSYNADTWVVTAAFGDLPEDFYTLRLRSGDGRFEDLVGNDLDGSPGFPLPSGDGTRTPDDFAVPFSVDLSSRPANAFVRLAPLGGLMFGSLDYAGLINIASDQDDLTFFLAGGQTVAAVAVPDDPGAALTLALNGGTPVAGAAGQPVVLPPQFVAAGGLQSLEISGDAPTTFTLAIYRNVTLEALIGDSDQADPLPLDGAHDSYLPLGEQQGRWAVLGNSTPRNQPGDAFRFLASSGSATLLELQLDPVNQVVIGPMTFSPALDFEPGTGLLYGANDWLRIINPGTGQTVTPVTLNAATGTVISTIGAMGISSPLDIDLARDGFLYAVTMTTPQTLYRIDPATAAATPLGIYSGGPWGLASQTVASLADPLPAGHAAETPRADTAELDQAYRAMLPAESVGVLVPDVDAYTLDLSGTATAGRWIDVVLAGQDGVDFSGQVLELLAPDGAVLATAVADPLGVAADNYDLGILRFPVPDLGSNVYTLRVTSLTAGDYGLLVTDSLAFDSEPNDVVTGPLRPLDETGQALGYLFSDFTYLYADRATFSSDHPNLPVEDFEEGNVAPGGLVIFPGPVESGVANAAFDAADILPGIRIQDATAGNPSEELVLLGAGFSGNPSKAVGPSAFAENTEITFLADIFAVGLDILTNVAATVTVTAYGPAGEVRGTTALSTSPAGAFFGVASSKAISRVLVQSAAGDLIDNVAFGPLGGSFAARPWVQAGAAAAGTLPAAVPSALFDASSYGEVAQRLAAKDDLPPSPLADAYLPPQYHLVATADLLSPPAPNAKPLDVALAYVRQHAAALGLTAADVAQFVVTDQYTTAHNGVTHIYLRQTYNGLEIVHAEMNVNVTADGRVINVGSTFLPALAGDNAALAAVPRLSAEEALQALAGEFHWTLDAAPPVVLALQGVGQPLVLAGRGVSRQDIPARLQYVPTSDGVELAWQLIVQTVDGQHWYDAGVSAADGQVLYVADWADEAEYHVYPVPVESPNHGSRILETNPQDALASPYGWHDTNGVAGAEYTVTRGNNTYAYADRNGDDSPDAGSAPDGGPSLAFDYPVYLGQQPLSYQPAAVTNLFYWTNLLHDVHYQYGFDEAAGNFQFNNYGHGGLGNDFLEAQAQDGADIGNRDNANMMTPPDGSSPVMQMYLWDLSTPERDGDFDNGIIIHEFGHGVSNRLTGGPANAGALDSIQSGGMGEGWSDWYSLIFTQEAADTAVEGRGIGTYALNQPTTGAGIRSQRYSYDMAVNDHTFADIRGSTSVHFIGETWATALWDLTWLLIQGSSLDPALPAGLGFDPDLYGGSGGNNVALQLVTDGLKLQPALPSFLDARDALLLADQVNYDGAHQLAIWKAFARRGMGYSADDGGSSQTTNVVEAFDLPSTAAGTVALDRQSYSVGDSVTIEVRDLNLTGTGPLAIDIVSSGGDVETVSLTEVALGAFRGTIATLGTPGGGHDGKLNVALGNVLTVTYRDADDGTGQSAVVTDTAAVVLFVSFFAADFSDAAGSPFGEGFTLSGPANEWHLSVGRGTAPGHSADDSFYFGGGEGPGGGGSYGNNADGTLTSPLIDLTGYLSPTLSFNHFLQLEAGYDNARVYAVDGSVVTEIWTGSSNTAFETVELDLGAYADKQIRLRFRFTSDISVTDEGWYVDDVILRGGVLDPALIGPRVAGIDPPSGPTEDLGITQITVTFSEPVTEASAEDPDSYALVEAGADGVLGTGDDVVIAVVPTPDPAGTVVTLAVAPAFAPLAPGQYRLTLDGTSASPLMDLDGNPLNSTTGPNGGRDLVHEFDVFFDFQPGGDIYTVDLAVGDTAAIATATPFADADSQPLNDLDPLIVLFDPAGRPVARDANSLDGKNARLTFTATVAGTYKVQVLAESGAGEYQLSVAITAPAFTVTGLSPTDNAAGVAADTNLAITFSEAIRKGAGTVVIRKSADNSAVETIDVSSTAVTVAGSTVTIDPAGLLAGSTSFYVEVSAGAFEDLAGNDFAGISGPTAWNFNTNLIVTSLTPTSTGFHIHFNRDLAVGVLNLYDQGGTLGLADLTLTGAVVGDIRGSLVIGSDRREATFIKTNTDSDLTIPGLLQPDRYTVTLKSAATAFCDTSGGLLDGDGNGTPGGDYVGNFTVAAFANNAVTVSLPNVTRGYGQPVNLPADNLTAGLPLTISNGLGVTRVELTVQYDSSLLAISAFALAPAVPSGAAYVLNTSTPGRAVLTITASTVLANSAGPLIVGSFTAVVPNNAPYAGKHILDITNLRVLDNSSTPAELPAFDDDAIHVAAFFGDANGDGAYNSPDATLTRRIIGLLNTGLAAYQLADPRLIVDISGNGSIQSNDTTSIRRAIGQVAVPNIPALPSGLAKPAAGSVDPKIYFPLGLAAAPGETVTEPVRIELPEPAGLTIGGLDLVVEFEAGTTPWSPSPTAAGPSAETDVQDRVFDDLERDLSPLEGVLGDLADDIASAWR